MKKNSHYLQCHTTLLCMAVLQNIVFRANLLDAYYDDDMKILRLDLQVCQRTSKTGLVRWSVSLLVTQTFDNPPGAPIGLLGLILVK